MVGLRFKDILSGVFTPEEEPTSDPASIDSYLEKFHHFTTPTLPHLLALLTHQSSSFPLTETSLIVIESISTLFALAFPKTAGENAITQQNPVAKKSDAAQWASGRRWAVMGELVSKISRLAATKNIAVLLTSQTTTRIRSETGAVLHPAISGSAWDTGISARAVIFRDWMFQASEAASSQGEYVPGVRFAGVVKANGVSYEGVGKVATFVIEKVSTLLTRKEALSKHYRLVFGRSQLIRQISDWIICPSCQLPIHYRSVNERRLPIASQRTRKQSRTESLAGLETMIW